MDLSLDIDKATQKALENLSQLPEQEKPEFKTYIDVLVYRLDEFEKRGDVGYKQEILIPIPEKVVREGKSEPEAKKLIMLAGIIKRELNVEVDINTEEIQGRHEKFNMINLIFGINNAAEAKMVKEFITRT